MRCCFVRHGETPWNIQRRMQGHQDIPLNALGLTQADAAARHLAGHHALTPFAAVASSDLQRARQTAEMIGHALDLPVQIDPGLRERHYGGFEGKTPPEACMFDEIAYDALLAREDLTGSPGNVESLAAMVARIETSMRRLATDYADQAVILVTHGGVLDILYRQAMGRELTGPRDAPIPNAGLNWLDLALVGDELRWTMVAWGETGHLNDASLDEIL